MLQRRLNPMFLIHPKSDLEFEIKDYYILYNIILCGILVILLRIEFLIEDGMTLTTTGYTVVLLLGYSAIRYLVSLFYLIFKVEGLFYKLSFNKMRYLVKLIEKCNSEK